MSTDLEHPEGIKEERADPAIATEMAKQEKSAKISIAEMREALLDESCRLDVTQRALVASGIRSFPDEGKMRRADVFRAADRLLGAIEEHIEDIRTLVAANNRKKSRAGKGRRG